MSRSATSKTSARRALVKRAGGATRGPSGEATITDDGLAQIERDSAAGLSNATIAKRLGIHRRTLMEIRRRDERVEEALQRGRGKLEDDIVDRLLEIGHSDGPGAVTALIWLSKNRLGWRDQGTLDGTQFVQVNNFGPAMTTGDLRARLAELLAQRERLLADGDDGGAE